MATTKFYISAGLVPTDNFGDQSGSKYFMSAGLVPTDTAAAGLSIPIAMYHYMHHLKHSIVLFVLLNLIKGYL